MQRNHITKVVYQGANQGELAKIKAERGYKSNEWLTFVQARSNGLKLENAKGQGVHCRTFPKDKKTGESYPKYFVVFNFDLIKKD